MQQPQSETITLSDILITEKLSQRSPRSPNLQAENQAMRMLAQQMVNAPEAMLQSLVDMAVKLCQAGTAGVSLLETTSSGEEVFRWNVLAGTLKQYVGGTTPRNFSPCGVSLERGAPQLFSHPERYFTYFQVVKMPIVEGLVLPLIADNHALGTIWITSHDQQRHFDSEDVRVMASLADFTAAALLLKQRQTGELLATNAALEAEIAERKQTEEKLRGTQKRLELSLTGANLGVWTYNVGTDEFWADDRAKQMHGHESQEVHTFAEAGANIHPEDRDRSQAAIAQAIQNCSKLQIEYRVLWPNGSVHGIASYAEFTSTGDQGEGMFYGVVQDISDRLRVEGDRKRAEAALRESEERSRALIENLPGGAVFVVDHDLRYVLAEGEALAAAGFKPGDLIEHTIFEVLPPELAAYYEVFYRQTLAGEPFEHEHNAHDRSYISRGTPLRSPNGEIYAVLAVSYDISDRKQAEAALRESEEKYRSLFSSMDEGYFLADVLFDENDQPIDIFYLDANPAATAMVGSDYTGRRLRNIDPSYEEYWYEIFGRVARTGEGVRMEQYAEPDKKWYNFYVFKVGGEESRRVAVVFQDITERKRHEANLAFLAEIANDFSRLTTADEMMQIVGAKIGAFLNVPYCHFMAIDEERDEVIYLARWNSEGVMCLPDKVCLSEQISEDFRALAHAGETLASEDTGRSPITKGEGNAAINAIAFITVPFLQQGEWKYQFSVHDIRPRAWREDEIELVRELADRIFPRLERARAEAALRASEEKYRTIFNSIDEGFCLVEVLFDEKDNPIDHRILEANPAFEKNTGIKNPNGQTASELAPGIEQLWNDLYGRVVKTGKPERVEEHSDLLNRWFDVLVSPVGDKASRTAAVTFADITERKRAEAALRESEARLAADLAGMRRLYELHAKLAGETDLHAALEEILATACEFTNTDRGCVQLVGDDGDRLEMFAWRGYRHDSPFIENFRHEGSKVACDMARRHRQRLVIEDVENFPPLAGTRDREVVLAEDIRATQSTPMITRQGEMVGVLSVQFPQPHRSTDHELRLIDLLAWTAADFVARHHAERAVRGSEERFRLFVTAASDILYRMSADWSEMHALEGKSFLADTRNPSLTWLEEYIPDSDKALVQAAITNTVCAKTMFELEHRVIRADGTVGWTFSRAIPFLDEQGEIVEWFGAASDITERKRTETNLAFLAEVSQDLARLTNIDETISALGEKIGRFFGVKQCMFAEHADEFETSIVSYGWNVENAPSLKGTYRTRDFLSNELMAALMTGEPLIVSETHSDARVSAESYGALGIRSFIIVPLVCDREWRFQISIIDNKPREWRDDEIELLRELTARIWTRLERTRAEEALRQSEEKYRTLFDSIDEGFCTIEVLFDEQGGPFDYRFLTANPAFERQTGLENAIDRTVREFAPQHEAFWFETYGRIAQTGEAMRFEHQADALNRFFDVYAFRIGEPEQRQVAVLFNDITERKRAEADHIQLIREQAARAEAERASQMKDEFLSMVSHELQSPLVAILGWTRLLRANPPAPAMLTKSLQTIERNATLQAKLVQDLLDISRITAGRLRLSLQPVELKSVIEMAIATVTQTAFAKVVNLVWQDAGQGSDSVADQDADSIVVMGDCDRLQQILCNLLTNAIKFTPEGGQVEVRLEQVDQEDRKIGRWGDRESVNQNSPHPPIPPSPHPAFALIQVKDTGIGISPEFLPYIFNRFHQAEKSGSAGGVGLGLAIAHHLVELHGGSIIVQSPGVAQGTTFTIKLPLVDASL